MLRRKWFFFVSILEWFNFAFLSGNFSFVVFSRGSYHWVTGPKEGGGVRGFPIAAVMVHDEL